MTITYAEACDEQQLTVDTLTIILCLQVHHQIAETISDHRALQQCARVVAWLEALFLKSQEYRAEQEQGTSAMNVFKYIP